MREFRASELGSCISRQIHKQLGSTALDPPATLQAAFDRGNVHEDACIAEMRAQGWKVRGEQDEILMVSDGVGVMYPLNGIGSLSTIAEYQAVQVGDRWQLTGHLDGRCNLPSDYPASRPRVLEVKAPGAWAKFERAYKTGTWTDPLAVMYAWQTSVYMVATGLECVVACLSDIEAWSRTDLSYQYGEELRWFVIETPIHSETEIIARCEEIHTFADLGVAPSECEPFLRDDWSCPYRHLHSAPERPEVEDAVLDTLVGLYAAEKALRDRADEAMKRHREKIDEYLGLDDTRETSSSIATRVTTTRTTLDKAAVRAAGIDLVPFERQSVSTSIRITVKDQP